MLFFLFQPWMLEYRIQRSKLSLTWLLSLECFFSGSSIDQTCVVDDMVLDDLVQRVSKGFTFHRSTVEDIWHKVTSFKSHSTNICVQSDENFSCNKNPVVDDYFLYELEDIEGLDLSSEFNVAGLHAFSSMKGLTLVTSRKYRKRRSLH